MDPNQCPICGKYPESIVTGYSQQPFIDGNKYQMICFTCANTVRKWDKDESLDRILVYKHASPFYLNTVADMIDDGWKKPEAEHSLKSVRKKLHKVYEQSNINTKCVLEVLFLQDEIEVIGFDTKELHFKVTSIT